MRDESVWGSMPGHNPGSTTVTCKETIRLICEYLDGKLVPSVDRDIKAHLDQCKDCRMVLDAARKTLREDFGTPHHSSPQKSRVA